jgi:hypothetical protein
LLSLLSEQQAFLWRHPDDQFSEVVPLQHSDESTWRVFETVDDVLAVANATRGDARTNLAQEAGIVLDGPPPAYTWPMPPSTNSSIPVT